jgi:hypothetical protein
MYVSAVVYPMALVAAKNARVRLVGQVQSIAYIIESTVICWESFLFWIAVYFYGNDDRIFSRYSDFNKTERVL